MSIKNEKSNGELTSDELLEGLPSELKVETVLEMLRKMFPDEDEDGIIEIMKEGAELWKNNPEKIKEDLDNYNKEVLSKRENDKK